MTQSLCICTNIRQAALSSTAFYDAVLAPSGLKVTMFRLLRQIEENSEISITDLATLIDLDRSTLGRNLRVLQKQGMVEWVIGTDGRARIVKLTVKGCAALDLARPLWQGAQEKMTQEIGADYDTLLSTLQRVTQLGRTLPEGRRT